jgi:O-antigen/teichoic acid export membrane protein
MKKLRQIFTNAFIYSLSTLLSKAVSFLLLPILTYYLSRGDYGILGIITAVSTIVSTYVGLNPSLFLIVKGGQKGKAKLSEYIYHSILLTVISFGFVLLIIFVFHTLFLPEELSGNRWILVMIAIYSLCNTNIRILDTVLQLEKKAFQSSLLLSAQSLLSLGLALLLIIRFSFHWEGMYFSDFLVTVLLSGFSLTILRKKGYIRIAYDKEKLRELFQYLFPLTFHVIGIVIISSADKFFISKMISLQGVGIYNIACTVGMVIAVLHDSLLKAWNPFFFEEIHRDDHTVNIKIVRFIYLYFTCSIFVVLLFVWLLPWVFPLLINEKFSDALPLIPIIAFGYTIMGARNIVAGYLYHAYKTNIIASLSIMAGCINIGLNYFLIQHHGLYGAAESMLLSYIFLFLATLYFANRYNRIPWRLRKS